MLCDDLDVWDEGVAGRFKRRGYMYVYIYIGDLIPGSGRSPGGGHENSLENSCLENHIDRGAWWATDHRVSLSQT